MPYNSRIVGHVIRDLRRKKGWSQEVLSGLAGMARSHLSEIENGTKSANAETLWRISEALGIRMSEMIRMAEQQTESRGPQ